MENEPCDACREPARRKGLQFSLPWYAYVYSAHARKRGHVMLTGKDIHEATAETSDVGMMGWEQLSINAQQKYNAVAERLNSQLSRAEEEANRTVYSATDILLILPHVIKGMQKLCKHPEQEYND